TRAMATEACSRGAEMLASAIAIGVKPAKNPMSRRVTKSCHTERTRPITAMMTVNAASERISIIFRPKRSASRPKIGGSKPDTVGVTAASSPDHIAMADGSVTPSSRMYSGRNGEKNWNPTNAMNTERARAQTLRCQPSGARGMLTPRLSHRLAPSPRLPYALCGHRHRGRLDHGLRHLSTAPDAVRRPVGRRVPARGRDHAGRGGAGLPQHVAGRAPL